MPRAAQDIERIRDRERQIVRAAREIAEQEGWSAVTVRRLADAIGFSQPILYRHFPRGRDEIVERVVIDGYAELLAAISADGEGLAALVAAYLAFARENPAVYYVMTTARTGVVFASDETPELLRQGFAMFERAVGGETPRERAVRAELLWSTLHGVSRFAADGRLDAALDDVRDEEIVALFSRSASGSGTGS
ncbi:TetR/AcrR family transcriptional regulator [Microbacterium bovistercoris]|uniref:TetR/AcrR family transcriptional regulator n=1 Tax=Microbacterium bovistercoris TaxID=2293570 RepID=A0A371NP91_9MICO|nr:TetR/AcrR family transcriptional regulator [Microbacterium bovistercoris]REJ03970.1 TetR/AcrR family transcriptional regulator [Microbacterium bovistercoris]